MRSGALTGEGNGRGCTGGLARERLIAEVLQGECSAVALRPTWSANSAVRVSRGAQRTLSGCSSMAAEGRKPGLDALSVTGVEGSGAG
jgi:hypothetical protein